MMWLLNESSGLARINANVDAFALRAGGGGVEGLIFFGILIYMGASFLVNGNTLNYITNNLGTSVLVGAYTLYLPIKLAGLSILAFETTRFKLS
ncbi:MAG: hypothetical protein JW839_09470 [Candidatus Lokiarchaeota archaeon]|nr:hypothetical protein [Candidatus Lokiarchaeota archaeon]